MQIKFQSQTIGSRESNRYRNYTQLPPQFLQRSIPTANLDGGIDSTIPWKIHLRRLLIRRSVVANSAWLY